MANEENRLTEGVKKIFLAGLGAMSIGADKSREVLDTLVRRGELTAEQARSLRKDLSDQGKTMSQELAEKVTAASTKTRDRAVEALKGRKIKLRGKEIDLSEVVGSLSLEQLEALKDGLGLTKKEEPAAPEEEAAAEAGEKAEAAAPEEEVAAEAGEKAEAAAPEEEAAAENGENAESEVPTEEKKAE